MALVPSSAKVAVGVVLPHANRLRARVIPRFPANLVAGNGISITKNGATYIFTAANLVDGDKGDITISGGGTIWTIDAGAVTASKLEPISQGSFFSRTAPGTGAPVVVSSLDATLLLQLFTDVFRGLVPPSGGGTTNYLRADGTWSPPGRGEDVVPLSDVASVPLDAALGNMFKLVATGNRTIAVPGNKPGAGETQRIVIVHEASGGARTLSLTTGSAGAFRFGADITSLSPTTSGLTDYIGAIYNASADRWDVVSYVKGF